MFYLEGQPAKRSSAKNCLLNHRKDAVYTGEANVLGLFALTQYTFYCYDCGAQQVASYIRLRKGKKDDKRD